MATTFKREIGRNRPHAFLLETRVNGAVVLSTSHKKLVNFGPLTPDLTLMVWRPFMRQMGKIGETRSILGSNGWQEPLNGFVPTSHEDVFGPSLGQVGMSRSKIKGQGHQGQKNVMCTHNTPAVWTKWNGLVTDNVAQAAGASN